MSTEHLLTVIKVMQLMPQGKTRDHAQPIKTICATKLQEYSVNLPPHESTALIQTYSGKYKY